MFARLGTFVARHPVPILAAWLVVLVVTLIGTPSLDSVVSSSQAAYLPDTSNVQQARAILLHAFPTSYSGSSAFIVLTGPQPNRSAAAAAYSGYAAERLTPRPDAVASDSLTPALHAALNSPEGQVTLVSLGWRQLDTSSLPGTSLKNLRAFIKAHAYRGVTANITGDLAISTDYQAQIDQSTSLSAIVTVILVLALLLIIFRSVALPLVPLVTLGIAIPISMGVVALLGTHGMVISSNTPIFLIVLLVGVGTDYCLFMTSRFREQLLAGMQPRAAIAVTVRHTGAAIASSGLAVIVGMAGMGFAQFGLFNTTGPAMAIGVGITLLAGLTIAPAVLCLLGPRTFWPVRLEVVRPAACGTNWLCW